MPQSLHCYRKYIFGGIGDDRLFQAHSIHGSTLNHGSQTQWGIPSEKQRALHFCPCEVCTSSLSRQVDPNPRPLIRHLQPSPISHQPCHQQPSNLPRLVYSAAFFSFSAVTYRIPRSLRPDRCRSFHVFRSLLSSIPDSRCLLGSTSHQSSSICWDRTVDCLLYTSPSPRDRTRSRMPSSA